jgi:hypothetical protein
MDEGSDVYSNNDNHIYDNGLAFGRAEIYFLSSIHDFHALKKFESR